MCGGLFCTKALERDQLERRLGGLYERFKEFRLRQCGLAHPIYLVEDYGSTQHFTIPEETLLQAIANSQVVDGFYLKRTRDLKESVAYLTLMTRYLQSTYSNKTLKETRKSDLENCAYKNLLDNDVHRLMTFKEFNEESVKTKALTVREFFVKQLMQLHGLTMEKAAVIVEQYPTPAVLMEAYKYCVTDKEREVLLADLRFGPLARKVGVMLSKQVYMLYYSKTAS